MSDAALISYIKTQLAAAFPTWDSQQYLVKVLDGEIKYDNYGRDVVAIEQLTCGVFTLSPDIIDRDLFIKAFEYTKITAGGETYIQRYVKFQNDVMIESVGTFATVFFLEYSRSIMR